MTSEICHWGWETTGIWAYVAYIETSVCKYLKYVSIPYERMYVKLYVTCIVTGIWAHDAYRKTSVCKYFKYVCIPHERRYVNLYVTCIVG